MLVAGRWAAEAPHGIKTAVLGEILDAIDETIGEAPQMQRQEAELYDQSRDPLMQD
jgi:hypothetical protein